MAGMKPKGGKKGRKYGRNVNSPSMQRYRMEMRWIKNKLRKLARRIRLQPNDVSASSHLIRLKGAK